MGTVMNKINSEKLIEDVQIINQITGNDIFHKKINLDIKFTFTNELNFFRLLFTPKIILVNIVKN